MKLPHPIEFSEVIKPVELACDAAGNFDAIAIGNGLNNTDDSVAPILRYTHLKTVSGLKCFREFKFRFSSNEAICAIGEGKRSVCGRDLGGPLVAAESNALVGITSLRSFDGCDLGKPQGFTRVSNHLQWIEEVTGVQNCKQQ